MLNFVNEIQRFHKIDVTKIISQNFLTISASYEPLTNEQIKLKYPPEIAERFIKQANEIDVLSHEYNSDKFSIDIRQNLYITKKKVESDFKVSVTSESENRVTFIKELKDPSDTHKYNYNTVITAVSERLKKKHIELDYPKGFNSYVLNLIIDFYDIKREEKYAYKHIIGKQEHYTYSQQFIDFVVSEIEKQPSIFVASLKAKKTR